MLKQMVHRVTTVPQRNGNRKMGYENVLMKPITCFGFEVLTATTIKSTPFGDVTLCSLLEFHRRFVGTCCLHLFFGGVGLTSPSTTATSGLLYSPR
jgi:hypothetical protein